MFINTNYYDFFLIRENIAEGKKIIASRYNKIALADKKAAAIENGLGEEEVKNIKLTPEETKNVEKAAYKDIYFSRIKEMLKDNDRWVYTFTKLFFNNFVDVKKEEIKYEENGEEKTKIRTTITPIKINPIIDYDKIEGLLSTDKDGDNYVGILMNIYDRILKLPNDYTKEFNNNKKYIDAIKDPNDPNSKTGYELMSDDLTLVELERDEKKNNFIDQLPKELKDEYKNADEELKSELDSLGKRYTAFLKSVAVNEPNSGIDPQNVYGGGTEIVDGDGNLKKVYPYESKFKIRYYIGIGELKYKSLKDLAEQLENYLNSNDAFSFGKLEGAVKKINKQLNSKDLEIVYPPKDKEAEAEDISVAIVRVKTYDANYLLNSSGSKYFSTNHCIANNGTSYWQTYVLNAVSDVFNTQYYIYNFNLDNDGIIINGSRYSQDTTKIIGVTLYPNGEIRHVNNRTNTNSSFPLKEYFRILGIPWEVMKPMSEKEIRKAKFILGFDKILFSDSLTTEELEEMIKETPDAIRDNVNSRNGLLLYNAINSNNIENAKIFLELGANANIVKQPGSNKQTNALCFVKSIEMAKLIIDNGVSVTANNNIALLFAIDTQRIEIFKFLLDNGADPNKCGEQGTLKKNALNYVLDGWISTSNMLTPREMFDTNQTTKTLEMVNILLEKGCKIDNKSLKDQILELMFPHNVSTEQKNLPKEIVLSIIKKNPTIITLPYVVDWCLDNKLYDYCSDLMIVLSNNSNLGEFSKCLNNIVEVLYDMDDDTYENNDILKSFIKKMYDNNIKLKDDLKQQLIKIIMEFYEEDIAKQLIKFLK